MYYRFKYNCFMTKDIHNFIEYFNTTINLKRSLGARHSMMKRQFISLWKGCQPTLRKGLGCSTQGLGNSQSL